MTRWGTTESGDSGQRPISTQRIYAPFAVDQVEGLARWQNNDAAHPFTCGGDHDGDRPSLEPTTDGWYCPDETCDYTQNWAHAFMADAGALSELPLLERFFDAETQRLLAKERRRADAGMGPSHQQIDRRRLADGLPPLYLSERVEAACEVMHDAYEQAAVGAGWETSPESRKPWADVPETNKATMRAAVRALFAWYEA